MDGFQLTLFFSEESRHHDCPLGDWLLRLTHELGLRGVQLLHGGALPAHVDLSLLARFFGRQDLGMAAVVLATEEECDWLLARIEAEEVTIYYVKFPVACGVLTPRSDVASRSEK